MKISLKSSGFFFFFAIDTLIGSILKYFMKVIFVFFFYIPIVKVGHDFIKAVSVLDN